MRNTQNTFENFYVRLFPTLFLKNKIFASIVDLIGRRMVEMKQKIDKHLDLDI